MYTAHRVAGAGDKRQQGRLILAINCMKPPYYLPSTDVEISMSVGDFPRQKVHERA